MITVIMPAAGKGTRLNLPYPKEILRLDKDQALIDFSFDFFLDYGRKDVQFVVVINEDKTDIVKYLGKYKDRFNIAFTYQNPHEHEYTGAIKSARHLLGRDNIVLLPDTVMTLPQGMDIIDTVSEALENAGYAFFYKPEADEQMLRTKGALNINSSDEVMAYEDKPSDDLNRFNAYWCSFAFTKSNFDEGIAFMERSTLRQEQMIRFEDTPLCRCRGIQVADYKDLGTWQEIRRWLASA